jgi:hypothetical protein
MPFRTIAHRNKCAINIVRNAPGSTLLPHPVLGAFHCLCVYSRAE